MPRTIWKGAISFGLVHVPVALHAASREHNLDFDWLDRRDKAPVGYQRVNKRTGKPVESDDIVKGYEYERGRYVLLSDEDFRQANPEATQTVEILGFVDVAQITPEYFEKPYWLEALPRAGKGYALLREVMRKSGRAALASVVIGRKQHLATVLVRGPWLLLVTLRWADEVLAPDKDMSEVPQAKGTKGAKDAKDGKDAKSAKSNPKNGFSARELEMAERLVDEMTQDRWDPAQYKDSYRDDLMARIESRIASGRTEEVTPPAEAEEGAAGGKVIDLMAALRQSLRQREAPAARAPKKRPAKKRA